MALSQPRPPRRNALWEDLKALAPRERHQQVALGCAVLITTATFAIFAIDFRQAHVVPAPIIYVESWPANRTDAEIVQQQKIDSAKLHAAQKERQREFQKLARALHIE
jgi:hypothetical protein